jgi:hypothetical protein
LRDATSLVEAFDEFPELKAGGGADLQRILLDAILTEPDSWWADQLNVLIRFSKDVSIWLPSDEAKLRVAITQYKNTGIDDEFDNCHGIQEYEGFRDDLIILGENLGTSFTRKLQSLEERLAELDHPEPEYRGRSSSGAAEPNFDGRSDTDAAIREVFGALLD